ncbi:uncharacterized protein LOC107361843 [Tetranychus urticae]|uniref:Ig-like domain-containing protein n=1 Tax=Tetranychus urticae TaxID=32264 RepID=T1JTI2_TETUR|nr:uncharacterized protein LOC107361843 [Tetranychus urticae]
MLSLKPKQINILTVKTFILLITLYLGKTVHGLRINKLEVPSSVPNGTSIVLYCDYDLEGLGLYSVKWYKNYVEFFRYIPSEDEKVATFKLDGAYVDIDASNATHVALARTDLNSEGSYACEVSTDQMYTTIRAERQMKIYVLSDEKITIEGKESEYDVNRDINLTCISGPTKPAARLVWYINDRRAEAHQMVIQPVFNTSNGLFVTRLGLVFHADRRFFIRGLLKLQCTAGVILTFQFESSEFPLGDGSRSKPHKQLHGAEVKVEKETPIITKKDNHKYRVGDTLYLNCTSQSKVAHLMWFINEDKANASQLKSFTGRKTGSPPILGLILNIEQQHFQLPEFKVRCVATIHERIVDYYSEEIQIRTENQESWEAKSSYDPTFANYAKKVTESGLIMWTQLVAVILYSCNVYTYS